MKLALFALLTLYMYSLTAFGQEGLLGSAFRQRLQNTYNQYNEDAKTTQVIIGTLESIAAVGLERLIYKPDAEAIKATMQEIATLQKVPTAESFEQQIRDIRNNPQNYIEIIKDDKTGYQLKDLQLHPSVELQVQQLQQRISRYQASQDFSPSLKKNIIYGLQSQIDALLNNTDNYIDAHSLPRHSEIVGQQLNPRLLSELNYLEARRMVAMKNADKEAKIKILTERLNTIAGRTTKGRALRALNVLVRAGQVALVLDIGVRVYVITALDADPGHLPTVSMYCAASTCKQDIERFIVNASQSTEPLKL